MRRGLQLPLHSRRYRFAGAHTTVTSVLDITITPLILMDTETLMTSAIGKVSIMMIMQNNEHTNFIWLHTGCSDKLLLKFSRLPQGAFTIDTLMNGSTGTGCAERWCTALPWGYSEPVWALCCTTCSGEPALAEGVEWDLQRTPPASTNPWCHIFHRQEMAVYTATSVHPILHFSCLDEPSCEMFCFCPHN